MDTYSTQFTHITPEHAHKSLAPSNPYITHQTRNLLYQLNKIGQSGQVLLGHQSTNTLGRKGITNIGNSDIKDVCGQFPGMVSYDLGWMELNNGAVWLEGRVAHLIDAIKYCRKIGLPICLSWHTRNPIDKVYDQKNRNAKGKIKDVGNTVSQILTNPAVKKTYLSWLAMLADFFGQLQDGNGNLIPVLFRPFHECNGGWFWWGKKACSAKEYIELYQLTHDYLTKEKKVDHLLWVYNTDKVFSEADFMERYPGDTYIDLLSLDFYDSPRYSTTAFRQNLDKSMDVLVHCSKQLKKGCFIAEGGLKNYSEAHYFTERCVHYFNKDIIAFIFWANTVKNYYVTYAGDPQQGDFLEMLKTHPILLADELGKMNIYR